MWPSAAGVSFDRRADRGPFMDSRIISRRALLVGGVAIMAAGCSASDEAERTADPEPSSSIVRSTDLPDELEPDMVPDEALFAEPWLSLADDEMDLLGAEVLATAPETVAHAEVQLAQFGDFGAACDHDVNSGALVDVAGWMMPSTMAGLAGGLAMLHTS